MKRVWLIVGSLAFMQFFARAQSALDTSKYKVSKSDIELVYNQYMQQGDHSAITGGNGSEKLTVYGPAYSVKNSFGKNAISIHAGTDIISSASTDKIDFVVSSASLMDIRYYLKGNYSRQFERQSAEVSGGLGISMESDYFSIQGAVGFAKTWKNNQNTFSAQLQMFNDDLRWGRLNPDYYKPVKLIYPQELRYKEWFHTYRRNSYNLKIGFTQVLSKRNVLGVFPELGYQHGLLSTPFHRIYFSDGSEAVENLPSQRLAGSIALKLNTFAGGIFILKNAVCTSTDNFGIRAISVENETAIKARPFLTFLPSFRFYTQKGSGYFSPYMKHLSSELYYTSDYDLSSFRTYTSGFGIKYSPHKAITKNHLFDSLVARYYFMFRTQELKAHIISLTFQASRVKSRVKKH